MTVTKGFVIFLSVFQLLHANLSLTPGIYKLEGKNPGSEKVNYRGEVEIVSNGSNYELTWTIGSHQAQTGIGILQNDILSVAYYDLTGKGTGVGSYQLIAPDQMNGYWTGYGSKTFGEESLILKTPNLN
jgi:hypothetical protein